MVVVLFLFSFSFSFADISKTVNYQGKITTRSNGILLADGTYDMRFKIYDALTEGNLLWTGTHTTSNGNPVSITSGVFSVLLGSGSGNTLDLDFSTNSYYLEVSIYNTDTTSWEDFSPRKQIASVPQAYNANSIIGNGNINLSNTSASQDAAVITYNPTSGSNDALEVVYGSGGGSGTALKITQSGSGDILRLYDDSTQVFTVLDGGNVGIGTTSPDSKLDIGGVNGNYGTLGIVSDSNHKALNIEENSGGESWQIGVNASGDLVFMDSNAEIANASMVIQDGGYVGIGTTSPDAPLKVSASFDHISGYGVGTFINTYAGSESSVGVYGESQTEGNGFGGYFIGDSTGVVGESYYGGTTVGSYIGVSGSATGANSGSNFGGYFGASGAVSNYGIFADASGGTYNYAIYSQNGINFFTDNVGIGVTDPQARLDVSGGSIQTDTQLISTVTTGTAPLAVTSTTAVTNLNADLLDGNDATAFATSNHTHSSLTQGNGITSFTYDGGSTQTVALGNLTSDWSQTGAYDIVLGNGTFNNTSASADLYATGNIEADGTIYGTFSGSGASLTSIPESSISDGSLLARVAGSETISGGWTFTSEPTLSGSGRHLRQMKISPEYTGAVLTAFYGSGTDTSINGTMTSDTEPSADSLRTYYEWTSSQSSLNYYTVAIRVALPSDFSAWATSDAIQVDFDTESTSTSDNILGVYVYNGDDTPGTAVASSTSNASSVADTWTTVSIDDSAIDDGSAPDWDDGGETAVIYLRMGSLSDNFVRIGDIKLNYLSKW